MRIHRSVVTAAWAALCLVLASTRKYAILGAGLLLYFYPFTSLGVLALAGVAFIYLKRRNPYALSRLFNRGP